jgi:hypothetical protein
MALTTDQSNAMTALRTLYDTNTMAVKDLELITNKLQAQWGLSAADAKTLRAGVHPGHRSFGPDV